MSDGVQATRVLIVEDEQHLAQGLLFNLQAEGYDVTLAFDGESGMSMLTDPETTPFDAVLLDVMLPGRDGFSVASELRAGGNFVPILMLTARGRPEDVLAGLEAGADDYVAKPFDLSVLLARLHVLLRRVAWGRRGGTKPDDGERPPEDAYSFSGRTIDFSELALVAKGERIRLTVMEAEFLRYLSENPMRIIPRRELLEQVWRVHEDTDTRAIDNFVVRLRRYIEDEPAQPVYLKTVRGVGYRFLPNGE